MNNSTCKCPSCGKKCSGVKVNEDDFGQRMMKKGAGHLTGAATGAAIGSIIPGLGTAIGGAVGALASMVIQSTDTYNNAVSDFVSTQKYKYSCPTCGHTWKYSLDEAERKHRELVEEEDSKAVMWGLAWAVLLTALLVYCINFWWLPEFYSEAAWWIWTLTVIGYIVFFGLTWGVIYGLNSES